MIANAIAENVLGTIGTICWTLQLVPQVWKSWRAKKTEGLSPWLVLLWGISSPFLGVYVIVQNLNIPLIVQPQAFGFLSICSWVQCLYYDQRRPRSTCIAIFVAILAVMGGFEAGMVFVTRHAYHSGNEKPVQFFGVFSSVLTLLGLVPQYYEIYYYREVVGISIPFVMIDMAGGAFNTLSLAFKEEFDVIAGISYSLVVLLDAIIIVLALILNPIAKRRREAQGAVPSSTEQHSNCDEKESEGRSQTMESHANTLNSP